MARGRASDKQVITAQQQRLHVLDLREAGYSFRAIAAQVGCSVGQAHAHYYEALDDLKAVQDDKAENARLIEEQRLDAMLVVAYAQAQAGDLAAIDRVLRISERRAKLLGLDAPTKAALTTAEGDDVLTPERMKDMSDDDLAHLAAGRLPGAAG